MEEKKKKTPAPHDVLEELKKAFAEGRVIVGNDAARADKGSGSVLAWVKSEPEQCFGVEYSIPGTGFGGFVFKIDPVDVEPDPNDPEPSLIVSGRLRMVDSECMSREFVKKVLCQMVDEAEWDTEEGPDTSKHDDKNAS